MSRVTITTHTVTLSVLLLPRMRPWPRRCASHAFPVWRRPRRRAPVLLRFTGKEAWLLNLAVLCAQSVSPGRPLTPPEPVCPGPWAWRPPAPASCCVFPLHG